MEKDRIAGIVSEVVKQMAVQDTRPGQDTEMTLELAKKLMEAVEQEAAGRNLSVVTAVADASARPVAVHCMKDAYIASYDIALNKAFTSASLKMSTAKLGSLSQPGESLYGIQYTNQGRIVIFGGGEPLIWQGKVIGALGVSGGTAQEDTELAAYGRKQLEEVIMCR